jgi:hypothetical protein
MFIKLYLTSTSNETKFTSKSKCLTTIIGYSCTSRHIHTRKDYKLQNSNDRFVYVLTDWLTWTPKGVWKRHLLGPGISKHQKSFLEKKFLGRRNTQTYSMDITQLQFEPNRNRFTTVPS